MSEELFILAGASLLVIGYGLILWKFFRRSSLQEVDVRSAVPFLACGYGCMLIGVSISVVQAIGPVQITPPAIDWRSLYFGPFVWT